jgi:hypothetical protein
MRRARYRLSLLVAIGLLATTAVALPSLPTATFGGGGGGGNGFGSGTTGGPGQSTNPLDVLTATIFGGVGSGSGVTRVAQSNAAIAAALAARHDTSSIKLQVQSSRNSLSGQPNAPKALAPIRNYHWLINLDNTGNSANGKDDPLCHPSSNPNYPVGCTWPSIRYAVASPAISEGTAADWNNRSTGALPSYDGTKGLPDNCDANGNPVPRTWTAAPDHPCRFLVSVTADGYQIGGTHFTVPMKNPGLVKVFLNPFPIPLGTMKLKVFADTKPTDGTYDEQNESGLLGFNGLVFDVDGIVTADYYSNALCTQYKTDPTTGLIALDITGKPTPLPAGTPTPDPVTGYFNPTVPGKCMSDSNGDITIPNLAPNHYSASVTPPDDHTFQPNWVQTTTLEGNHDHEVWIMPANTGLDTELVVSGEAVPFVQFGFTPATPAPDTWACPSGGVPGTTPGCGLIRGQLWGANPYIPGVGSLPGVGGANGQSGVKLDHPIDRGWVSLNSLNASTGDFDSMVATIPTNSDGTFEIKNVPDGDYTATVWDEPQEHALDNFSVTISNGQVVDMGTLPLLGWFAHIFGHVFIDTNGNGRQDPGEKGLFHATVQNLNRTNNAMVGGINTSDTDNNGFYDFKEAYPLGQMSINQFFNTRFKTTGITWQSCNDPKEHTTITPIVDVSYLPIIGQCGRLDWGVMPYDAVNGENGGEVATLMYDQIRQKYNARQAQSGDYQTGIPGMRVEQSTPVKGAPLGGVDGPGGHDELSGYALNADGSFQTVEQATKNDGLGCSALPTSQPCYMSENNGGPANCYPLDGNGKPQGFDPTNPNSLDFMVYGGACVQATPTGTAFGLGLDDPALHGVQTVDGNYALPGIPGADNLVHISVPVDHVLPPCPMAGTMPLGCSAASAGLERPLYTNTTEEDVNFNSSAQYVPQGADLSHLPWPARLANTPHITPGNYDENEFTTSPGPDPICAGPTHVVHVTNAALNAAGGSPFEGQTRHDCGTKLFAAHAGQSIAPNFHFHTVVDVPLPAHFLGYIVDDVSVETNKKSINIGEVHGIPGVPVGLYDWTGRRVASVNSDYNGTWEILMPSADIFNCPVPAGTCNNVYRFVGNDPGQPGSPNLNYDHNYRTISANFEAWPNMLIPADTAPTRTTSSIEGPGIQFSNTSPCTVKDLQPQIFSIGPDPYTSAASTTITIKGANFGPNTSPGSVEFKTATGNIHMLAVSSWSDHEVRATIGTSVDTGPGSISVISHQVDPLTGKPYRSTNGVTFHILGGGYNPNIITVGPGKMIDPFTPSPANPSVLLHGFPIQDALDQAATLWQNAGVAAVKAGKTVSAAANDPSQQYLIVVYPKWGSASQNADFLPLGTYFENLVVHSPVKLQGVGPGGSYLDAASGTAISVQGSIVDGRFFNTMTSAATDAVDPANGGEGVAVPGPSDPGEPVIQHWVNLVEAIQISPNGTGLTPNTAGDIGWSGANNPLGEGAVITVLGTTGTYPTTDPRFHSSIDGFTISGGDQSDFPGNLNEVSGQRTSKFPEAGNTDEPAGALSVQGGAVYVNGGTDFLNISNNSIEQNNGAYGAVRFGTLFQSDPRVEGGLSHNYNASVNNNVFAANGGQNLAGAIGIFTDTNGYSIDNNSFCMNSAAEYGGAISHHGFSPNGVISNNRIFLNTAFDEGGAITISSEPGFVVFGGDTVIPDPVAFTQGTGPVTITHNYISSNLAQDDGGAIRIMGTTGTKGLSPITITDNMITNNVSAHEGGAISLMDAPLVNILNNTIAKNLTTATATTSNGQAAPAGVSTGLNSGALNVLLQSMYTSQAPAWMGTSRNWPGFSNALVQNDVFHDNRAGTWTPAGVAGIGMPGDTTAINLWDVGSNDGAVTMTVKNSILDNGTGFTPDPSNRIGQDPLFVGSYDTKLSTVQQRTYFRFRPSAIISVDLPDNVVGDYRVRLSSPAQTNGVNPAADGTIIADDINGRPRPSIPTLGTVVIQVPITSGATEGGPA